MIMSWCSDPTQSHYEPAVTCSADLSMFLFLLSIVMFDYLALE